MKKTIITVFLIIAVLVIALIAFNIATNGGVWRTVGNAVAAPINKGWQTITGDSSSYLIDVNKIMDDAEISDGRQSLDGLTK